MPGWNGREGFLHQLQLAGLDLGEVQDVVEQAQQGTRGGYQLARTPAQISVADVIQAIDGPVTVTACSTDGGTCDQRTGWK